VISNWDNLLLDFSFRFFKSISLVLQVLVFLKEDFRSNCSHILIVFRQCPIREQTQTTPLNYEHFPSVFFK